MNPAQRELSELRSFTGSPKDFWPRYLQAVAALVGARRTTLLWKDPKPPGEWKLLGDWSTGTGSPKPVATFATQLGVLADTCAAGQDSLCAPLEPKASSAPTHHTLTQRMRLLRSEEVCVLVVLTEELTTPDAQDRLARLQLAADVPESYQSSAAAKVARGDVEKVTTVIDILTQVHPEKRSLAAGLAFCNAITTRLECERVSLGWLDGGYLRLQAISRTEQVDRKMASAQLLEGAMEECLDQDDEVSWPAMEGNAAITRDHERYAESEQSVNILSLPLRQDDKPVAVVTCERAARPFTATEAQLLRLACDQAIHRLVDLKRSDVWLGARALRATKEQAARLLGPENTWAKVIGAGVALLLILFIVVRVPYRVSSNFVLRSEEMAYLTAPFDGFIRKVQVRPGDVVTKDTPLLSLDTVELELESTSATADLARYQRESEKARAARNLADMRIAQALADQSKARLDQIQHRLGQASLKAGFAGVVAEGDLRDRIGAPVKQGEALLKIARTDTFYIEAEVSERDIQEIREKQSGWVAFLSQPSLSFPIQIVRIEPAAVTRNAGNVFLVRCQVGTVALPWWRPGMVGVTRIEAGTRSLLWIATHRTIDFLRLKFWW